MKKITILGLILSLIGWGLGLFLVKFYDCGASVACYNIVVRSPALYYGMGALAFIFLILIFTPAAFSAWKKFAKWFIPIATLVFILYPSSSGADIFSPFPEQVFKWISALYVIISVIIIIFSIIRQKGQIS